MFNTNISFARRINQFLDKTLGLRVIAGPSRRPVGVEESAWTHIEAVRGRTMGSPIQQYTMWQCTNYIERQKIPGAIAEFGVWRGGMSMIAARVLHELSSSRSVYLFDTFEGMTEPSGFDWELFSNMSASQLLKRESRKVKNPESYNTWCIADFEDVLSGMASTGLDPQQINLIKGDVIKTVPNFLPDSVSICRIDTDWYESTSHVITECWDRISPGGLLILDDYDMWAGSRKAVDEFFKSRNLEPLLIRSDSGRIAIKQ